MDISNIWNLFYLHRQKRLLITGLLLILVSQLGQAQSTMRYRRVHLEGYDDKVMHYGFLFAAPMTKFNIRYSDAYVSQDSSYQLFSPRKTGFRVGFVANVNLTEHFDFRMTPSVSLYGRSVEYRYPNTKVARTELRESTWVDLPLLVKYKSQRRHNTRMYVIGGISLGIEANVRRGETTGASRLLTKNTDLSVEYGVGLEQFFEYFKFAPELRFSHGLVNVLESQQVSGQNSGIRRLNTHTVSLYLNFE